MRDAVERELDALGQRMSEHGFGVKTARYFADEGILVFVIPGADGIDGGPVVIEHAVFLYPAGPNWEARLTVHGGPQWVRRADNISILEDIALEALRADAIPPNCAWTTT